MLTAAGQFDAARAIAAGDAALMAYVQQEHTSTLIKQKNAIELAAIGQADQVQHHARCTQQCIVVLATAHLV